MIMQYCTIIPRIVQYYQKVKNEVAHENPKFCFSQTRIIDEHFSKKGSQNY